MTNLIELLGGYSQSTVERIPNAINGLPGKFKFFPRTAEVKEVLDAWEDDLQRQIERDRRFGNKVPVPALPPPLRPPGTDYDSMVAKHGRPIGQFEAGTKWERYAGQGKGVRTNERSEMLERIKEEARAAMAARRRGAQEAAE